MTEQQHERIEDSHYLQVINNMFSSCFCSRGQDILWTNVIAL